MSAATRALAALVSVAALLAIATTGRAADALPRTTRAAPTVTTGIEYGAPGDAANVMDAYVPAEGPAEGRPAVVVVHGGGWTGGDRSDTAPNAALLASPGGFVAFNIEYGTGRDPRWTGELDDVRRAIRWVQDHAAEYGVDKTKIGVLGSSAGGHLAMRAVTGLEAGGPGPGAGAPPAGDPTLLPDANHPPVKAVASWSGPSDLTTIAPTAGSPLTLPAAIVGTTVSSKPPSACIDDPFCIGVVSPVYLETFLGCSIDDCPDTYVDASPVFRVGSSTPPMLLAGAQTDLIPSSQNFEMVNALTAHGITSRLLVVEGTQHADSYRSVALPPTIDFFDQFLRQGAPPNVPAGSPPTTVAGSQPLPELVDGRLPTPPIPAVVTDPLLLRVLKRRLVFVLAGVLVLVAVAVVVGARRRRRSSHLPSTR